MLKKNMLIPVLALMLSACMHTVIQPPAPSVAGSEHEVPVKSYLGSVAQKPALYVNAQACKGQEQLARVQVKRSFAQGLISWLTFNLYSPATFVYECANFGNPGLGDGGSPSGHDQ